MINASAADFDWSSLNGHMTSIICPIPKAKTRPRGAYMSSINNLVTQLIIPSPSN